MRWLTTGRGLYIRRQKLDYRLILYCSLKTILTALLVLRKKGNDIGLFLLYTHEAPQVQYEEVASRSIYARAMLLGWIDTLDDPLVLAP